MSLEGLLLSYHWEKIHYRHLTLRKDPGQLLIGLKL
jgi:hypothetical protein